MTLEEILAEADQLVPNNLTVDQKVRRLNQIQRQLFRDYDLPDDVFEFEVVPDVQFYPLPENLPQDRIRQLLIDNVEYPYAAQEEFAKPRFWSVVSGLLFIHPKPVQEGVGLIYGEPRPNELSASDLAMTPNFPEDYHDLLVLRLASWMAKVHRIIPLANSIETDFQELSLKADREFGRRDPEHIINDLAGWWSM